MNVKKYISIIKVMYLIGGTFLFSVTHRLWSLSCTEVHLISNTFLNLSFLNQKFDDSISERTFYNFINELDRFKLYFTHSDIEALKDKYLHKLDEQIKVANCRFVDDVINIYVIQFYKRQKTIAKLIDQPFDYQKKVTIQTDIKKIIYLKNFHELTKRWEKRLHYFLLGFMQATGDLEEAKNKLKNRYKFEKQRFDRKMGLGEQKSDKKTPLGGGVYTDFLNQFLNAFASSLDPHSSFFPPAPLEDFRIKTRLSFKGIGAMLTLEDELTTIKSLTPGGAAKRSGKLKPKDRIIQVGQGSAQPVNIVGWNLEDVVMLIRGKEGTEVRLTIQRKGKTLPKPVSIIREEVKLADRRAKSYIFELIQQDKKKTDKKYRIGVLNLAFFYFDFEGYSKRKDNYLSSARDVKDALLKFNKQNIDALIFDVRTNRGGGLLAAVDIAGHFIDYGSVVQVKNRNQKVETMEDNDGQKVVYSGPLVVMVNRQAASASEIFAGAIRDYQRGVIIGDTQTFGKGTVQTVKTINEKIGAVKVTIQQYFLPAGSSTQLKGVSSDIVYPSVFDYIDIGEKYYDYTLPWGRVSSSVKRVAKYIPETILKNLRDHFSKKTAIIRKLPTLGNFFYYASDDLRRIIKIYNQNLGHPPAEILHKYLDQTLVKTLKEFSKARIEKDTRFQKVHQHILKVKKEKGKEISLVLKKDWKRPLGKKKKEALLDEKIHYYNTPSHLTEEENSPLRDDIYLQDALKLAVDYVRLLQGKKSILAMSIKGFKPKIPSKKVN